MYKKSVVGYPKIGGKRELKFALESYFNGGIDEDELTKVSRDIRINQWNAMKESGIDFIPSNDFSLYDNMLDTAVMLGIIPERYAQVGLSTS
jgi:5-methyltetrahydropteroyltriglutamate--homocysteine methyltransferase